MPDRRSAGTRLLLAAIAVAFVAAGVVLLRTAPQAERIEAVGAEATLRTVETLEVRPVPVRARAEVAGVLEARRSVKLFAETQGPVIAIGAESLDHVTESQLLASVDPLLAEVAVESARAALARTESQLALARSNLARRQSLSERGVASESALEDAENAERVASAALREARAALRRARDDLAKKTIRAPFAGVLRSFPVEVGEFLRVGQQIAELLDVETARTTLGVSDREVVSIHPGQTVEVRVEAYPGETFTGRILRVGAAADAGNRKFPIEVEVGNDDRRLLPGMITRVTLDLDAPDLRMLVPRDATVDEFGLRFVYVIESADADFVARRRRVAVRSLPFRPAEFEVTSGLAEGEAVALTYVRQLADGERVLRADGDAS